MKEALLVFAGGGAGSVLRYLIGRFMLQRFGPEFPWGTFAVNVLGCLLLGFVLGVIGCGREPEQTTWRLLVGVGFCGGFTTFSTFAHENIKLLQTQPVLALLYMGVSLGLGTLGVGLGLYCGKLVR